MADEPSSEQFQKLIDEVRKNSGEMGKLSKAMSKSEKEREVSRNKLKRDLAEQKNDKKRDKLNRQLDSATNGFKLLQSETRDLQAAFQAAARGFIGGALLAQLANGAQTLVETYKDMAEVGQTFNGSVFSMAKAAAAAGLPLQEFASMVKKNSKTMAVYGQKPVMEMAKQVRTNTERFGMYGYTIEGLNDVTMQYLDTQRLYGNKNAATNDRSIASAQRLALEIGALAATTGESREQIMRITQDAMRDASLTSRMVRGNANQMQAFSDAAQESVAIMAAMPGEAGQILSKFAAQTFGWGNSLFAEGSQMFIDAGIGGMVGVMDQLNREVLMGGRNVNGATWDAIEEFKSQVDSNIESLRIQAMAGNQNAAQVLRMHAEVKNITRKQFDAQKEQIENTKALSAFMLSFSNITKRLLNGLLVGIFGGLENIDGKMQSLVDSPTFKKLEEVLTQLGTKIGDFFSKMKPEDVQRMADAVGGLIKFSMTMMTIFGKVASAFMSVVNAAERVGGPLAALAAGLAMFMGGKLLINAVGRGLGTFFSNMIGQRVGAMRVKADRVIVQNSGGGDFFDNDGGGKKRGGGGTGGGKATAKQAGKQAEKKGLGKLFAKIGGKAGAKAGAKVAGKSLLKKIPLVGLAAGGLFAGQRALSGDWGGAGLEVASGLAGTVPGLGTAASLAIDGGLAARDMMVAPKDDGRAMQSAMAAQQALQKKLEGDQKTAMSDPEQSEAKKIQQENQKMLEAQIALLRENNELMRKNNQLTSTIANGMT